MLYTFVNMEMPKTATRLHLTKDDKHLKNFAIWKTLFKQLAEVHLQYGKNLAEVANHAESAFRNNTDIKSHGIMVDIGQVLINELKSQAQVVKDKWSDYNEEDHPYQKISQVDGKSNKAMLKSVHEACAERKAIEHKVKRAQKKFFRAYDNTHALIEKIGMLEKEVVENKDMISELTNLKSKTDVYLSKYQSTYQSECDSRREFIERMTTIEDKWMMKEKENLETWIDTCRDLCHRLDETSPRAFKTPLDDESTYPGVFKKLTHERRMEDIRTLPRSNSTITKHKAQKPSDETLNIFKVNHTSSHTVSPSPNGAKGDPPSPESIPGKQVPESGNRSRSRVNRVKQQPISEETLDHLEEKVGRKLFVKESGNESDSDVEVIELEGSEADVKPKSKPIKDEVLYDPHYIRSSSGEELDEITPRPRYNLSDSDRSPQPNADSSVSTKENVYVAVIKNYLKMSKTELTLKIGMHIKQKQSANEFGMAYGWYKRNKMGVKKYGYYPVDHVVLLQKSSWVKLKI